MIFEKDYAKLTLREVVRRFTPLTIKPTRDAKISLDLSTQISACKVIRP